MPKPPDDSREDERGTLAEPEKSGKKISTPSEFLAEREWGVQDGTEGDRSELHGDEALDRDLSRRTARRRDELAKAGELLDIEGINSEGSTDERRTQAKDGKRNPGEEPICPPSPATKTEPHRFAEIALAKDRGGREYGDGRDEHR